MSKPWYVIVDRANITPVPNSKKWNWERLSPYGTGPIPTKEQAEVEMDSESSQTFCFLTIDAKNEGYTADDCYMTQSPPSNAIMFGYIPPEPEED